MRTNFDASMVLVFAVEGGYSNDPRDPGGATNMGITIATARDFYGKSFTVADLKSLTKAQAKTIYAGSYWSKINGDALPAGVDYAVMDYGVNSGPARAVKVLQAVVGVPQDGIVGPATLAAVAARNPDDIIKAIESERLMWMQGLSTWPAFGKGWTNRVAGVTAHALSMAEASEAHGFVPEIPASAQAAIVLAGAPGVVQAKATPPSAAKANARDATVVGTVAGGGAAVVASAVVHASAAPSTATGLAVAVVSIYSIFKAWQRQHELIATSPAAGTRSVPSAA